MFQTTAPLFQTNKLIMCFRQIDYLFGCCDSQHLDQTSITLTPNFDQLRHLKCRSLVEISTKLRHLTLAQCVSKHKHAQSVVRSVFETSTKLRPNFDQTSTPQVSKFGRSFDQTLTPTSFKIDVVVQTNQLFVSNKYITISNNTLFVLERYTIS